LKCPNCGKKIGLKEKLKLKMFVPMLKANPLFEELLRGKDNWCAECIKKIIDPYVPDWVKGEKKGPQHGK